MGGICADRSIKEESGSPEKANEIEIISDNKAGQWDIFFKTIPFPDWAASILATHPLGKFEKEIPPGTVELKAGEKIPNGTYYGYWDKKELAPSVIGTILFDNGDCYIGSLENFKMHGKGRLMKKFDKSVYEGEFSEGVIQGAGKLTKPNGDYYRGFFQHGTINGQGTICEKGDVYTGSIVNGERSGNGRVLRKNGENYEGLFAKNKLMKKYGDKEKKDDNLEIHQEEKEEISKEEIKKEEVSAVEPERVEKPESNVVVEEVIEKNVHVTEEKKNPEPENNINIVPVTIIQEELP